MSPTHPRPAGRLLAPLFVVLLSLVVSCGGADRPAPAEWQTAWTAVIEGIPSEAELGTTPDRETCDAVLSFLRDSAAGLSPKPDAAIEDVVDEWVQIAEDAFFECPPREGEIASFADAYAELRRLEAEVATVLRIDRGDS